MVVADRIEREILIDAPVEVVWEVVTEPKHIGSWFSDVAGVDVRPGGDGSLTWFKQGVAKAGEAATVVQLRVERIDAPHFFSFRWNHPEGEEPHERNSLLVEFSLAAEKAGTRLRVVESGVRSLERPDDEKTKYFESHGRGWDVLLAKLREYAVEQHDAAVRR